MCCGFSSLTGNYVNFFAKNFDFLRVKSHTQPTVIQVIGLTPYVFPAVAQYKVQFPGFQNFV